MSFEMGAAGINSGCWHVDDVEDCRYSAITHFRCAAAGRYRRALFSRSMTASAMRAQAKPG